MKRFLLLIFFTTISINILMAQAKKPTVMVVPGDNWCKINGFMMEFDNQGTKQLIPNYKKAFQDNTELLLVISKINGMMAERGFPLKNMETVIKRIEADAIEDAARTSKESGMGISESYVDKLKKVAKADIIMQLNWKVNKTGPKRSISFNLQGLDSYTSKQVATAVGTGNPSFSAETAVLLEEAVLAHMDNFCNSLQNCFDDLAANGREVTIMIKKWDDWDMDLESEFGDDGDELSEIIENWMADHTKKGRFNTSDATENMMVFEQVRIPLYDTRNGRQIAMDTRRFVRNLRKYLKGEPYNIVSKVVTNGLGRATLILGSK